jgi:hypothetical protein
MESLCKEYKRRMATNVWTADWSVGINRIGLTKWYEKHSFEELIEDE